VASILRVVDGAICGTTDASEPPHVSDLLASLNDRRIALAAVQVAGESLKYVAEEYRSDREVLCTAVHQCGKALRHAAKELRQDRAIALAAVAQDGLALQHVSEELLHDAEVVAKAVGQNEGALAYAPEEARETAFMQEVLGESDNLLDHWKTLEGNVFGKMCCEHSTSYLAKREEFIELIRNLAQSLGLEDTWWHALTMLDAYHCNPRTGQLVLTDIVVAATMLAGRMANGRLNYIDQGPMVALHFGRGYELKESDLTALHSAEVAVVNALGGRLLLPSVPSWTDVTFRRLTMLAGNDTVGALNEARPIANQVAEILCQRIPASAAMPPRVLATTACAASLIAVGLLPVDEVMLPGKVEVDSISAPLKLPLPLGCKGPEGTLEKWSWPLLGAAGPHLEAAVLAKAVCIDVTTLRAQVRATLCASKSQ
jgi:uncharacterized membrane protein